MNHYTLDEVSEHNTEEDAWIVVNNNVYDITDFLMKHPGGESVLLQVAGTDASEYFNELHQASILDDYGEDYKIGELN